MGTDRGETNQPQQRRQQNQIEREMSGEAQVFARVTEAAARDVEAANFGRDGGDDENGGKRGQDRQSSEIKTACDERESAQNFQPGEIKCEPHSDSPRQNFVVVDVAGESNWVERFNHAGVNENAANDKFRDSSGGSRNS